MLHIGLFEGIGGFALAAKWIGWKTVFACEIDELCQKVLRKNFPEVILWPDIKTLKYDAINYQLSKLYGTRWRNEEIIITGGFP